MRTFKYRTEVDGKPVVMERRGQLFTGFLDDRGEEIYEGDTVELRAVMRDRVYKHRARVYWARGGFVLVPKSDLATGLDWLHNYIDNFRNLITKVDDV